MIINENNKSGTERRDVAQLNSMEKAEIEFPKYICEHVLRQTCTLVPLTILWRLDRHNFNNVEKNVNCKL